MYVCQLSNYERLRIYKAVKAKLLELGLFSYEGIMDAMNSKISDLEDLI